MDGVPNKEIHKRHTIVRFNTPAHNNIFYRQLITYFYFAFSAFIYAYKKRKNYDIIFATSSRLGTGLLGFIVSTFTKKPLFLDIRDIFSDNLKAIKLFKGFIGNFFIFIFKKIESLIIKKAKWVNFVSPGFFKYKHIKKLNKKIYFFTNGIDDIFIENRNKVKNEKVVNKMELPLKIVYAGNIGLGQGLELIVIPIAEYFKEELIIELIGDGSSVNIIREEIAKKNIKNIKLIPPVNRKKLLKHYNKAEFFLLHLNDIPAFKKVLPSKIFDYGSFDKPIFAGVKGEAYTFIKKYLPHSHLFPPGDSQVLIQIIKKYMYNERPSIDNSMFIKKFSRKNIMNSMLASILDNFSE